MQQDPRNYGGQVPDYAQGPVLYPQNSGNLVPLLPSSPTEVSPYEGFGGLTEALAEMWEKRQQRKELKDAAHSGLASTGGSMMGQGVRNAGGY